MPDQVIQQLRDLPPGELADARSAVKALIITGLGLNCEAETEAAFKMVGAAPERVHLLDLLDGTAERTLADYDVVAFIGGFAFGDHMGAGFVFANKIRWRLYDQLLEFIDGGLEVVHQGAHVPHPLKRLGHHFGVRLFVVNDQDLGVDGFGGF